MSVPLTPTSLWWGYGVCGTSKNPCSGGHRLVGVGDRVREPARRSRASRLPLHIWGVRAKMRRWDGIGLGARVLEINLE